MDPDLKQRLVGTAVLVGLAVIFVPMVLDGPVTHQPTPRSTGVPLALPDPVSQPETDAEVDDVAPAPVATAPAPAREPAASGADGWAVQLGSFSAAGNADALAERIAAAGFDAFVQRVQVENGTMYRVRVGPVAERDAALALAERIGRQTGERAVVVPHP